MYTLAADEKSSLVMVYTRTLLMRGELVTKQGVRVSTWLRTDGAPEYLHVINAQVLNFMGSQVRSSNHPAAAGTRRARHRSPGEGQRTSAVPTGRPPVEPCRRRAAVSRLRCDCLCR